MLLKTLNKSELKKLFKPHRNSSGEDNGLITIIGGSKLFHGAPLLSLKVASRIVDMVFFASPEPSVGSVAERIKSSLFSFIWIPWKDLGAYIEKSDAVLIGPGFMSFRGENDRVVVEKTKRITQGLLQKFPRKKWVIDAGSLQVMDAEWIPKEAVLTPNRKEFGLLFGGKSDRKFGITEDTEKSTEGTEKFVQTMAKKYKCTIVLKGPETIVCSPDECVLVKGGNAGMTKGGTGDVLAGLTVALLAKNNPFLASSCASYIAKAAADELYKKVGVNYNADDLADKIPETLYEVTGHK